MMIDSNEDMDGDNAMNKKQHALNAIRIHAFNGDTRLALRVYTENRTKYADYMAALKKGFEQRKQADKAA